MALYCYLKTKPKIKPSKTKLNWRPIVGISFSLLGSLLLLAALGPLVYYQLAYAPAFGQIISPLAPRGVLPVQAKDGAEDYTLLKNWFRQQPRLTPKTPTGPLFYYLSIPKLGIKDAVVQIGAQDLKKSLIHYPDTALPGQYGNAVIFGHSVLPQFFNPKNYLTIFSTLYKLQPGDEILINYDGINYRYLVTNIFEVPSEELSVLAQRFDNRWLTLITCSPPGTYLRRLVVQAQLSNW